MKIYQRIPIRRPLKQKLMKYNVYIIDITNNVFTQMTTIVENPLLLTVQICSLKGIFTIDEIEKYNNESKVILDITGKTIIDQKIHIVYMYTFTGYVGGQHEIY